jgi:NitT/TauT family transport system substrate-binding protein
VLLIAELAQAGLSASDQPGKDVQLVFLAYADLNQALMGKNRRHDAERAAVVASHQQGLWHVEMMKPYDTPIGAPVRTMVISEKFYKKRVTWPRSS